MFLLDTSILSDAQNPKPLVRVQRWLRKQACIAIPFPVILEIEQGIVDVRRTKPHKADELRGWLADVLVSEFEYPEITPEVARTLAEMNCCGPLKNFWYVNPNGKKEKRPSQDLFIAAISIVHDLPLATMNEKDFAFVDRYFPLPGVYNPNTGCWAVQPDHLAHTDAVEAEWAALEAILERAQHEARMLPLPFDLPETRLAFA
jgi:predicted nucleic acid-binding protein